MDNKISRFLNGIYGRLVGLRQARKLYEPLLATDFSPINIFSPNENDISRFLADLLSPSGSHGQGSIFLEQFIQHFQLNDSWLSTRPVHVQTEASTFNGRRIDIKLSFREKGLSLPSGIIGIENKPWAVDQKSQIADYMQDLSKSAGNNHYLFYLSGSGEGPTDYSTHGNVYPNLKVVSYRFLNVWLRDCASQAQAIRVQFFIDEFATYIDRQFCGIKDLGELKMITDEICNSTDSLESAFSVFAAMPEIKNHLLVKLFDELNSLIKLRDPKWCYSIKINLESAQTSRYKGIFIQPFIDCHYQFGLEFQQNECGQLIFGICKTNSKSSDRPELYELVKEIYGSGSRSTVWPWYKNYEPSNWKIDSAPWLSIKNGEMAERIFKDISDLYDNLEKEKLLTRLY